MKVHATIVGDKAYIRALAKATPEYARQIVVRSLQDCARLVEENAKMRQIIRGGSGPPDDKRLTSRSGQLRDSIKIDQSALPAAIDIGTDIEYGAVHEFGFSGTVKVKRHGRTITQAFGRPIKAKRIKVRTHSRAMKIPKRPYLAPAIDAVSSRFPKVFLKHWREASR